MRANTGSFPEENIPDGHPGRKPIRTRQVLEAILLRGTIWLNACWTRFYLRGLLPVVTFLLGTAFIVPIIQANVQEWAKGRGYDQYLTKYWGPVVQSLTDYTQTQWFTFVLALFAGGTAFLWFDWLLRTKFTKRSNEAPGAIAKDVELRLLFRPNQEPLEVTNRNVWRWFVYANIDENPATRERRVRATQVILIFDRPIDALYRRIAISRPDVRPQVIDLSARGAVISVNDTELTDTVMGVSFSADPI
jgi:hypothetical protein